MKLLIAVLIVAISTFSVSAADVSYSTEATITLPDNTDVYQVSVRVTELTKRRGKLEEKQVAIPINGTAALGQKASMFAGDAREGVTVDMFCPKPGEGDAASCQVKVTRGKKVVSTSKLRLQLPAK